MNSVSTFQYRVIKCTTVGFGEGVRLSEDIVWQGFDTKELSRKYPPSEIFGADPLGHAEIEGGHIRFDYRFERFADEQWQEIDDPRVRLNSMTALEREIDAENRRLFPGDYGLEDEPESYEGPYEFNCEHCHDSGCSQCEPWSDACEKCGMDPCYCDVIAEQEATMARWTQEDAEHKVYEAKYLEWERTFHSRWLHQRLFWHAWYQLVALKNRRTA